MFELEFQCLSDICYFLTAMKTLLDIFIIKDIRYYTMENNQQGTKIVAVTRQLHLGCHNIKISVLAHAFISLKYHGQINLE